MSFFDDIVFNVKSIADNVGKKANQIKDYSKLKYSESGIKAEIVRKKQALGGYIYDCSKHGDIDKEVMQGFVEDIDELEENLQITREMLTNAKNKITCTYCKAENEKDSVYCCKCGQKLAVEQPIETPVEEPTTEQSADVTVEEKKEVTVEEIKEDVTSSTENEVTLEKEETVEELTEE